MQDKLVSNEQTRHWASFKEAGSLYGMQLLLFIYKLFGRKAFTLIVYPVSIYFVLFRPAARQASMQYLQAHYKTVPGYWKKAPTILNTIFHFKEFAETILDKLLTWVIVFKKDDLLLEDRLLVDEMLSDRRGQLVIGSHFGNLEFCRGLMKHHEDRPINILVYDKHSTNFVTMMNKMNPDSRLNVYQVDEFDVQTMLLLKAKIDKGEWVFIAGDRTPLAGMRHTVNVQFLEQRASLPIGCYILAKALECPVKLMFAYRKPGADINKVYFSLYKLTEKLHFTRNNRQEKMQIYAQEFISELERHCRQAPYQWFNFYDFWAKQGSVQGIESE